MRWDNASGAMDCTSCIDKCWEAIKIKERKEDMENRWSFRKAGILLLITLLIWSGTPTVWAEQSHADEDVNVQQEVQEEEIAEENLDDTSDAEQTEEAEASNNRESDAPDVNKEEKKEENPEKQDDTSEKKSEEKSAEAFKDDEIKEESYKSENSDSRKEEVIEEQKKEAPEVEGLEKQDMQVLSEDDFLYEDNGDGTATITGYSGEDTDIVIPDTLDGLTVINIGSEAFFDENLTSVEIPSGIESIGYAAFANNALTSAETPSSVISIDGYAFYNNTLTNIKIGDGVDSIGVYAFYNNNLTSAEIPSSVTSIEEGAFTFNALTSIKIGDGVENIGVYAFSNNKLTNVKIPSSVTTIGPDAFSENPNLSLIGKAGSAAENYAEGAGVTFQDFNKLFTYTFNPNGSDGRGVQEASTQVIVTAQVAAGEDIEFKYIWSESETAPSADKEWTTFSNGGKLEKKEDGEWYLHIQALDETGLTADGVSEAFLIDNASSMSDFEYKDNGDGTATITDYTGKDTDIVIPEILDGLTVISIGSEAFHNKNLTSVEIPISVTSIEESAFWLNNLTEVEIPSSVTTIGNGAFNNNQLASVEIADSVTSIGEYAFSTNQLVDVEIPTSVERIEDSAFKSNLLTSVEIPSSVNTVGSSAFAYNQLSSVKIAEGVENIESSAFAYNQLTQVEVPISVESIEAEVFRDNQLSSVEIAKGVGSIGDFTFANNALTSVKIPTSVKSIGYGAFNNNQLTLVKIPTSVENIEAEAFLSNTGLFIIGEPESEAEAYAGEENINFLDFNELFTFTFNPNGGVVQEASTQVTIDADERAGEDINFLYIWSESETAPPADETWTAFSSGDMLEKEADDGKWYLHLQAIDEIGLTANCVSEAFHVDNVAPNVKTVLTQEDDEPYQKDTWTNQTVTISVEASDEESGIDSLQIEMNEEKIQDVEGDSHELSLEEPGIYELNIKATDKAKNQTTEEFTVQIDQTAPGSPQIELDPEGWTNAEKVTVTIEAGEDEGSGVSQTEYRIGENDDWKTYTEPFQITEEGETTIYARTVDQAGNISEIAQAAVKLDRTAPVLTLLRENPLYLQNDEKFADPGYEVTDQFDKTIADKVKVEGKVDTKKIGIYTITYTVKDHAGNETQQTREVHVVDTTAPEITLEGKKEITIELGDSYQEAGAVATDNYDGDITEQIEIAGKVDTNQVGTYQVTYTVQDSSQNTVSITRTVHVADTTAPSEVTLEAAKVTTNQVSLTFSAKDLTGIKAFILSRDGTEIARVDGENTTYTDEDVQAGISYLYELAAVDFSDNVSDITTLEVTTEKEPPAIGEPVTVEYVDEAGKDLAESEELTGKIGEAYTTEAKEIEGYKLMQEPENATGEFTEKAQKVTYVYAQEKEGPSLQETEDSKPVAAGKTKDTHPNEKDDSLPNTATNQYNWLIAGVLLILLGSSGWFIRRKRKP